MDALEGIELIDIIGSKINGHLGDDVITDTAYVIAQIVAQELLEKYTLTKKEV